MQLAIKEVSFEQENAQKPVTVSVDELPEIDVKTANDWLEHDEAVLIDVRETGEYEFDHVPGSLLLPLSFLDTGLFPPIQGLKILILCQIGKRSAAAQKQLAKTGIENTFNIAGGLDAWCEAGLDLEGRRHEEGDYAI